MARMPYAGKLDRKIYFIEKGITRSYVLHDGKQITTWFSKEGDAACGSWDLYRHPFHESKRTHGAGLGGRRGNYALPVKIEDSVWIGGGAILLPGVTIGKNSVIGAGSVVTRSIPANRVAVGNPCRVIKQIDDNE